MSIVLLAVSAANVICEVQNTHATLAAKYSTLAKIVAAQSGAALSIANVDDSSGHRQIVSDFEAEPTIGFAALLDTMAPKLPATNRLRHTKHRPSRPETLRAHNLRTMVISM